jgi:metal-responsive CopG/Arc/MetJ family transcriptional regulator
MMPKVLIPVRLDPEMAARLDEIVASSVGDRSDHLRRAVSEYIFRNSQASPVPVSRQETHLSTEGETDPSEPAVDESLLRVA